MILLISNYPLPRWSGSASPTSQPDWKARVGVAALALAIGLTISLVAGKAGKAGMDWAALAC